MNPSPKVWLITGVSTGLGRQLALCVAQAGDTVVGTVRQAKQAAEIEALAPGRIHGAVLDVNDHASVRALVAQVQQTHGRLNVLVNNAGYGVQGAVEEVSMAQARAQFETNVFAALNATQAVLPVMRAQKSGHILQISSQAGISATPGLGIYNASKFALEGFSEALAGEVAHLGIRVTLVEPGPFRTDWAGRSMDHGVEIADYAAATTVLRERLASIQGKQPGDPVRAAQVMIEVVNSPKPPLRLALGAMAVAVIRAKATALAMEVSAHAPLSLKADFPPITP